MITNVTLNPFNMYSTFQAKPEIPIELSNLTATFNWNYDDSTRQDLYLKLSVVTGNTHKDCEVFGDQFSGQKKYGTYKSTNGKNTLQLNREELEKLEKQQIKIFVRARWYRYQQLLSTQFTFNLNNVQTYQSYDGQSNINLDGYYKKDGQYSDIGIIYYYPKLGTYTFVETPNFTIVPNTDKLTKIKIYNSTGNQSLQNVQYKLNTQDEFHPYNINTEILLNSNNISSVTFINNETKFSDQNNIYRLSADNEINVKGKLYSLINGLEQYQEDDIEYYTFKSFFENCPIVYSDELLIKNNTDWMYTNLFKNCLSLITAPNLESINLLNDSYGDEIFSYACSGMFENCYHLSSRIYLPIDIGGTGEYSFYKMFYNCSSLIEVYSELLVDNNTYASYSSLESMFENCYNLKTFDKIDFYFGNGSYDNVCKNMFKNCYNLTSQIYSLGWGEDRRF